MEGEPDAKGAEALFVDHLGLVERVTASICRRHALFGDDAEEFASWAKLRLIEDDYRRIRSFRGESRLSTYLNVTLHHLFHDWRNGRWGKWRPSAAARRLGPAAVELESLHHRDGRTLDEAIEILATERPGLSREEVEELARRLPERSPRRRFEGPDVLEQQSTQQDDPEAAAVRSEAAETSADVQAALQQALAELPDEDRVMLRLRFLEGFKIVEIAHALGLRQKPLYRRLERLFAALRQCLEEAGVRHERIVELLAADDLSLELDLGEGPNDGPSGTGPGIFPSGPSEGGRTVER